MKFLKQSLGRPNLCGLVFTITEIPVPLIREIVAEILGGEHHEAPEPAEAAPEKLEPETPLAKPVPVASDGIPAVDPEAAGQLRFAPSGLGEGGAQSGRELLCFGHGISGGTSEITRLPVGGNGSDSGPLPSSQLRTVENIALESLWL